MVVMSDVTRILSQIESGDPAAAEELLPLVYDELRRLAARRLSHEKSDQTLEATALVHEAYLRLVDREDAQSWSGRAHFFAAAAEAMRRILVDHARRRAALKRGGDWQREELHESRISSPAEAEELLSVHEALDQLAAVDREAAELVKLRFFVGLPVREAAELLGMSERTADHVWAFARAWLRKSIERL